MSDSMEETKKDIDCFPPDLEKEIEIRARNLKSMQEGIHHQHVMLQTVQMKRIAKEVVEEMIANGHFRKQETTITDMKILNVKMDAKLDTIIENQTGIKTQVNELYDGRNKNSERITKIETTGYVIGAIIVGSWAVWIWWFAEFKESIINLVKAAHDSWK